MEFTVGSKHNLGEKSLSEEEIIQFARDYDPLEFHLSKEAAEKSIFKGLVASGSHLFHWFYKERWIPEFGKSVMAGLQLDKWKFLLPVYAGKKITASATVISSIPNKLKNSTILVWLFEFKNENGETVQSLELTILHKDH